jgi:hypothetical protein
MGDQHVPGGNALADDGTYVRQETAGYPDGLREQPDLEAPWPSGMCGTKRVCDRCPSSFLCTLKARAELDHIRSVNAARSEP